MLALLPAYTVYARTYVYVYGYVFVTVYMLQLKIEFR